MGHSRDETASLAEVDGIDGINVSRIAIGLAPEPILFKPWHPLRWVWLRTVKSLDVASRIGQTPAAWNAGPGPLGIGYANAEQDNDEF